MIKTFVAKPQDVKHDWYHIDASEQIVGRLAVKIAVMLMGKHKPIYTSHVDTGDFIVVTNAEKVCFTGNKWNNKVYRHHTGYPGGLVEITAKKVRETHAERILYQAVKRMLPKTKLGAQMIKKFKVYCGSEHPHAAQMPQDLDVSSTRRG